MRSGNLPLVRLEPIFRKLAEARNPDNVRFGTSMTDFTDHGSYVTVDTKDDAGKQIRYRCQYLVGADGGRTVGAKLGVAMQGTRNITDMVSVHFGADLSEYWDDRYFACHFINGECGTVFESGAIVPMGPNWGKQSAEWVFHFGFAFDDEKRHDDDESALVPRIRQLLKIPDLDVKVHKISHWAIERVLADKYRVGRVFLAGDAGNRRPPTTGLGLNTAIEDSLNLAWKLRLVLGGQASEAILDSYESERRAVGRVNCDWGLFTFSNSSVINTAVGLVPGQQEANRLRFQMLFEDSDRGHSFRAQVGRIIDTQSIEFCAHGIELGFRYPSGFLIEDGSIPGTRDPLGLKYYPTTRPGNRLPHAWLDRDGEILSTHDLVQAKVGFVVVTDADGDDWAAAADELARELGCDIATARIGTRCTHGDYEENWQKHSGLQPGGAVLVRPDNIVAWRSVWPSKDNGNELRRALRSLLRPSTHATTNGIPGPVANAISSR